MTIYDDIQYYLENIFTSVQIENYTQAQQALHNFTSCISQALFNPFPHYSLLASKLELTKDLEDLTAMIDSLLNEEIPSSYTQEISQAIQDIINQLIIYGSLFYLLHISYNNPLITNQESLIFFKPINPQNKCSRDISFTPCLMPENLMLTCYSTIVQPFIEYNYSKEKLKKICTTLFENPEKNDSQTTAKLLADNQENLFELGSLEVLINYVNMYKDYCQKHLQQTKSNKFGADTEQENPRKRLKYS